MDLQALIRIGMWVVLYLTDGDTLTLCRTPGFMVAQLGKARAIY